MQGAGTQGALSLGCVRRALQAAREAVAAGGQPGSASRALGLNNASQVRAVGGGGGLTAEEGLGGGREVTAERWSGCVGCEGTREVGNTT